MWLRNFYNILTTAMLSDDVTASTTQPTEYNRPIMCHKPDGSWSQISFNNASDINDRYGATIFSALSPGKCRCGLGTGYNPSLQSGDTGFIIVLGTGTTPVNYDDYRIETPITSGISLVSTAGTLTNQTTIDNVTHHVTSTRSFTVNNSSASPITINEFAIYASYGVSVLTCCVYREVLTTPVTLNPSESCIVSFSRDAEVYNYTPY